MAESPASGEEMFNALFERAAERLKAEERAKQSEQRYRELLRQQGRGVE